MWKVIKVYPIESRTDFFKYTIQKDNILAKDFEKKEIFLDDKDHAQRIADAKNRIETKLNK